MVTLWARTALTAAGWERAVRLDIGADGCIDAVSANSPPVGDQVAILLPAPANLHSHAFQRAMAGLTENRSPQGDSDFWSWRELMYRFLAVLTPEDVEAIAALAFMESAEAGYAAIGEFHYLHHGTDGAPYADIAEMAGRMVAAASATGLGLTLLPVLYHRGGCDGRPLDGGQRRFANDLESFARLIDGAARALTQLPADTRLGVAPHSLRAVSPDALEIVRGHPGPIHLHIAEQTAEVAEVEAAYGARPVAWLLDHEPIDARWCAIHATHMTTAETTALAKTGAVVGLCPITEANLGDGIFKGTAFLEAGGTFGIGTDSNVRIALGEELRLLEYGQRLRDRARNRLATAERSTGRVLFETAAVGGAQALSRPAGPIAPGKLADLMALDADHPDLLGRTGDRVLDAFVFAGGDQAITGVWSAGRRIVREGRHVDRERIVARYRQTMLSLLDRL